jgi:tetratricopeptide (TPR) repeat protein
LLADAQIARATGMRFAKYWEAYAEGYGGRSHNYKTFNQLEAEWENLNNTADWLWQTTIASDNTIRDEEAARGLISLVRSLERFLRFWGRWDEHIVLNERAYKIACLIQDWRRAGWCARDAAWTYYYRGKIDYASEWADKCVASWKRSGGKHQESTATKLLGVIAKQRKDYDQAKKLLLEALTIRRELGSKDGIAILLNDLGELARELKNYDEAEQYFLEALDLDAQSDRKERIATRCGNLGLLAIDREQWVTARKWFEQELGLVREIGRVNLIAEAQYGLARAHEAEGRADLALPLAQEALAIYERVRHQNLAETKELVERLRKKVGCTS